MGNKLFKVTVTVKPLPITVRLLPKFPIVFERVPFLIDIEVRNNTGKAYKESAIEICIHDKGVKPIKTLLVGSIGPHVRKKMRTWIRCPYDGKFQLVAKLFLMEKEIREEDSPVSWAPYCDGERHIFYAESTVVLEKEDGTVKYYKGSEIRFGSSKIRVHSLLELLGCIAAIASIASILLMLN